MTRRVPVRLPFLFGLAGLAALALTLLAFTRRSWHDRDSVASQDSTTLSDSASPTGATKQEAVTATRYPSVRIDQQVLAQIQAYAKATPGEITLLGASDYDAEQNAIVLRRVFLPSQTCTASSTEVSEEGLAEVLVKAMAEDLTLNVWIHSHGALAVFFSGTDVRSIERAFPQAERLLSIVVNQAGDMLARFTQFSPVTLEIDHLPITLDVSAEMEQSIREEVQAKVRKTWDRWEPSSFQRSRERDPGALSSLATATSSYGISYAYRPIDGRTADESQGAA